MDEVVDNFTFHTAVKQKTRMPGLPYQGRVKMFIICKVIV